MLKYVTTNIKEFRNIYKRYNIDFFMIKTDNSPAISFEIQKAYEMPDNISPTDIQKYSKLEKATSENIKSQLLGFQEEYKALTAKIMGDNQESRGLVGIMSGIIKAPKIGQKIKATTNLLDLIPIVGGVKKSLFGTYVGANIGAALTLQYEAIYALNEQIKEFIDNPKSGIHQSSQKITQILRKSEEDYFTQSKILTDLTQEFEDLKLNLVGRMEKLVTKYEVTKFNNLDITQLDLEDSTIYMACNADIDKLAESDIQISKHQRELRGLANLIAGKKVDLVTATSILMSGRKMSDNLTQLLEQAESGVESIRNVAEFQQLMTQAATEVGTFKNNFNEALALTTNQTKQISEMGDDLIPETIYELDTLMQSGKDITDTVKNLITHHGESAKQELPEILENLTSEPLKQNKKLLE